MMLGVMQMNEKAVVDAIKVLVFKYKQFEETKDKQYIKVKKNAVQGILQMQGISYNKYRQSKNAFMVKYAQWVKEDKYYIYIDKRLVDAWGKQMQQHTYTLTSEEEQILNASMEGGENGV